MIIILAKKQKYIGMWKQRMIKSSKPPETPPEQKPGEEPFTVIYAVFGPALVQTPSLEMLPSGLQLHQVRTGPGERVPPAEAAQIPSAHGGFVQEPSLWQKQLRWISDVKWGDSSINVFKFIAWLCLWLSHFFLCVGVVVHF